MLQKHAVPGSNPGRGTRFFARANALVLVLLQLGCGKDAPPRATCPRMVMGRAAGLGGLAPARSRHSSSGKSMTLPASRCEFEPRCLFHRSCRLRVRTAALQAVYAGSNPARNAMTSSRCSAAASARRSGRRDRRFESCRRDQTHTPVAQWSKSATLRTSRAGVRFSPGVPTAWRRNSEERVPACRAGNAGSSPAGVANSSRRVAQSTEQPALNRQAAGSSPAAPTNARLAQTQSACLTRRRPMARSHHRVPIAASLAGLVTAPA